MNWQIDGNYGEQIGNITKQGNLEYVNYGSGYANPTGIRTEFWKYGLNVPNGIMPTYTIGAGSIFQANITSITQVPQFTTQEDPSNGSLEYVIYQIPSGNYPYVDIYYNASWTFFSANFNATASPSVQTNYNTIFLNTVTFNPFAITFIQPIPIKKTNTISVTQVRGLTSLTPSTSQVQYTFSLQLNGGNLQYGLINNTASSGTFQIFNASTGLLYGDGFLSNQLYNQSAMAVNFTADLQGTYYYVLSSTPTYKGSQYSLQYTGKFNVTSSLKFTNGLHPTLTGVTSITQNTNNSYKLTIAYNNGTLINGSDSVKVLKNLSIQLQQSTTLIATLKANEISNGTFIIYLDEATAGNYFIVVTISPTLIGSLTASAQTDIAITVNPVALNVITVTQVKGISPLKPSSSLVQYNFSLRLNGQPLSSGLLNYTTSLTTFQVFNATSGLLYANGFVSDPLYSTSSITVNFTMNMQGSFIYTLSATSLSYDNSAYFLQYSGKINVTASLKYTNVPLDALCAVNVWIVEVEYINRTERFLATLKVFDAFIRVPLLYVTESL